MSIDKYFYFYRNKLFYSLALRKYKKEHPDFSQSSFILSKEELDKMCEQLLQQQKDTDTDCMTLDEKLTHGLEIRSIQLNHCRAWKITKADNRKDKIIYYIHGGGFTNCSTKKYFEFISYEVNHFGYNVF